MECHVANAQDLGCSQIVATGKAAVGRRLPRRVTIEGDVAFQHGQQSIAVARIARLDHQIEDHAAPAGGQVELVAIFGVAAAFDDDIGMGLEQADQLVAGRHQLAGQHPPLTLCDDLLDQRPIVTDLGLPEFDEWVGRYGQLRRRLPQIGQGGVGDPDQFVVEQNTVGSATCELDLAGALLGRAAMIAPFQAGAAGEASACFNKRTITGTASHSRVLSLGSCMSAEVTVLSSRTTVPSSSFACRAFDSSARLISSQVSGRIALIVFCSTDFCGLHDHGSRAKARSDAESSRWKASSW